MARLPGIIVLGAVSLVSSSLIRDDPRPPGPAVVATVSFVSVPTTLPRDTPLPNYSPLVKVQWTGLDTGNYILKVHLLDKVSHNCATPVTADWCGNKVFPIDNSSGANSTGTVFAAPAVEVHGYANFEWVVDIHPAAGAVVAHAALDAPATFNRAPVLAPIGSKSVAAGAIVDFTISATDAEANALTYSAQNLPPDATFSPATRQFHWQPSTPGTYAGIVFGVSQIGPVLDDAEIISIVVGAPPQVIAFESGAALAGEAGPATLKVIRTNGTAGPVDVSYSTSNGMAVAGSDFEAVAGGLVSFADGETVKMIRLTTLNDTIPEMTEAFQVTLSAPTNGAVLGVPSSATVTIVDDDTPSLAGQMSALVPLPTVPIHLHLLPNGKVLFWDRHADAGSPTADPTPYLWDPAAPQAPPIAAAIPPGWDVFCSGHALMADGRLFVAGGHIVNFHGLPAAGIYDPAANSWTTVAPMNAGRWYPGVTALGNGDLLVMAGTVSEGVTNPMSQIWQVASGTWRDLTGAPSANPTDWPDFYPYAYLAQNGRVFVAGPQRMARYLDTTGTGVWSDVANSSLIYRDYGTSAMYADGKVLIAGGNPRPVPGGPLIYPSASSEVIDLNAPVPAWREVAPMAIGRRHHTATILANGEVLVTGGTSAPGQDNEAGAVYFAELWNPDAETWTPVAGHTRYRGYHSGAVLLPNGTVLIAGGGHPGATSETNGEIYSPPYLFRGSRPVITTAPSVVAYGQQFMVHTPDAPSITAATLIRLSSMTHGFNMNQRINRLTVAMSPGGVLVTAPANANLCPPGHYMLFLLNGAGVPSEARIVQISADAPAPPGPFSKISPVSGATNLPVLVALTWQSSSNVTAYEYCYDAINNNACDTGWRSAGPATSAALTELRPDTTYYWTVRAANAIGQTHADGGLWWSFSVSHFGKRGPKPNASEVATTAPLSWDVSASATSYRYCVGTSNDSACPSGWVSAGLSTSVAAAGLAPGVTYYWQVQALYPNGTVAANSGAWWRFRTIGAFGKSGPASDQSALATSLTLSWTASTTAGTYEYCIDETDNGVCDSTWISAGAGTTVSIVLSPDTTYYWQVRLIAGPATILADSGRWWHFTTQR